MSEANTSVLIPKLDRLVCKVLILRMHIMGGHEALHPSRHRFADMLM